MAFVPLEHFNLADYFLEDRIPEVVFVEAMPRTHLGKTNHKALRYSVP